MAFDGCFHDNDMELTPFPRMAPTLTSDPLTTPTQNQDIRPSEGTRLRRQRSVRENVDLLVNNSYMIDSYSRLAFPLSYLLFNTIYWSLYSWSSTTNSPSTRNRDRVESEKTLEESSSPRGSRHFSQLTLDRISSRYINNSLQESQSLSLSRNSLLVHNFTLIVVSQELVESKSIWVESNFLFF